MKKFYSLLLVIFTTLVVSAQALLSIVKTSEGVYTMTYNDSANGWAFYDPMSQPIGVYLFINAADSSANANYNDAWTNITTQLTWDGTNYSGTINLNSHNFNQTGGILPAGTTVNQLNFLFTEFPTGNGSHQTSDKLGTAFGFTPSTTVSLGVSTSAVKAKSSIINGQLRTALAGNLSLEIYEMGGKLVRSLKANSNGNAIDLNINKSGIYLLKITNGSESEVVKFAK